MATITKTYSQNTLSLKSHSLKDRYNTFIKKLNFSYFAFISFSIAVSACLGGGVVKFCLEYNTVLWQFVLGMLLSLCNVVVAVGQFPIKWVFNVFVITTVLNIGLILLSVLT